MRRRTAEILAGVTGLGLATAVAAAGAAGTSSSVEKPNPAATYAAEPGSELPTSPLPAYLRPAASAVIRLYQAAEQPGSGMRVSREDVVFAAPTQDITFQTANGDTVDVLFTSQYKDPTSPSQINGFGASVEGPGRVPNQSNSGGVMFYDLGDMWGGYGGYLTLAPGGDGITEYYNALRTFGLDRACYGLRVERESDGELKARCTEQDLGRAAVADNAALAAQVINIALYRPGGAAVIPVLPHPNTPSGEIDPLTPAA